MDLCVHFCGTAKENLNVTNLASKRIQWTVAGRAEWTVKIALTQYSGEVIAK